MGGRTTRSIASGIFGDYTAVIALGRCFEDEHGDPSGRHLYFRLIALIFMNTCLVRCILLRQLSCADTHGHHSVSTPAFSWRQLRKATGKAPDDASFNRGSQDFRRLGL